VIAHKGRKNGNFRFGLDLLYSPRLGMTAICANQSLRHVIISFGASNTASTTRLEIFVKAQPNRRSD
jgi:hypothetical protein